MINSGVSSLGISPVYEVFYINSMLYHARSASKSALEIEKFMGLTPNNVLSVIF
jgi:hypothetical protein